MDLGNEEDEDDVEFISFSRSSRPERGVFLFPPFSDANRLLSSSSSSFFDKAGSFDFFWATFIKEAKSIRPEWKK